MEHSLFPPKTGFQCVLESRERLPQLRRLFRLLHREDFYGGELNLPDLDLIKSEELKSLLNGYQVKMNTLVTGVCAETHGLSLNSDVPGERIGAADGYKRNIDYTASTGCGIIIGFLKGGLGSDSKFTEQPFLESILKLEPYNRGERSAGPY